MYPPILLSIFLKNSPLFLPLVLWLPMILKDKSFSFIPDLLRKSRNSASAPDFNWLNLSCIDCRIIPICALRGLFVRSPTYPGPGIILSN